MHFNSQNERKEPKKEEEEEPKKEEEEEGREEAQVGFNKLLQMSRAPIWQLLEETDEVVNGHAFNGWSHQCFHLPGWTFSSTISA